MNKKPLISVIIPVYNVSRYIHQCIDSVLSSSYRNLEIILIDDDSLDDSGEICDEYAKADNRIKVIHQENGGLSAARNTGLEMMHGDYVAFLDSDDWIEPDCYEKAMQMILEEDLACVHYNARMVSEDGLKPIFNLCMSNRKRTVDKNRMISILLSGVRKYQFAWNAIYDAKLWKQIKFPVGRNWEDVATKYLAILSADKRIGFIPDYLINYRYNPRGISQSGFTIHSLYQLFLSYKDRYEFAKKSYPSLSGRCLANTYTIAKKIVDFKPININWLSERDKNEQLKCKNFIKKYRKNVFISPGIIYGVLRLYFEFEYWKFRIFISQLI